MDFLLGIDVGTTKIKVALADTSGRIVDLVSESAELLMPFEGACEMDMDGLWQRLCGLTKQLQTRNGERWGRIVGAGISAQGDGMWPIDAHGKPVGKAILWNDTRTRMLTDVDEEGLDQMLIGYSSTALFAGAFPMILKWIKQREGERYARIAKVLRCKDWLNFKLTGTIASDYSDFSTCGINIFSHEYVGELFDALDIREAKFMMPPLIASTDVVGVINAEAQAQTGIPKGVPLIAGAIDVVVTAVGAGVTTVGDGCTILGTTLCNEILIDKDQVNTADRSGSALCSIFPGKFLRVMAALSGNSTIDWAKGVLAPDLTFAELEQALLSIPTGSRGIIYHPYITGERAPFRNPFACGGFYGLTASHTRFDLLHAVFEGMVLSIVDCYHALPKADGKLYLSGGGAVSNLSCQLIANALGKEVIRPASKELGVCGILEAIKIGLNITESAAQSQQENDRFTPDPREKLIFDALYAQYVELRNGIDGFWKWRDTMHSTQSI